MRPARLRDVRSTPWLLLACLCAAGCTFATEEFTLGSADAGARADTGAVDAGSTDTGTTDTGAMDTGARDTGATDTGAMDTGARDTGSSDTGSSDTGTADTGTADTGATDTGATDTGATDAGATDTGEAEDAPGDVPDVPAVVFCAASRACPAGYVCDDGVCATACPSGQTACSGFCRATQTDDTNCGACGNECAAGQDCTAGACTTVCAAPTTNCSNVCRDLQADNNHCGACGRACTGGTTCASGTCACPAGQTLCSGVCVNLQTDLTHCGSCTRACAAGQVCSSGACVTTCAAGLTNCSGVCRNLQTDAASCGACGRTCTAPTGGSVSCVSGACVPACPSRLTNCGGTCVDLAADESNCGTCSNVCTRLLTTCLSGVCCARGTTNCSGVCRSLQSDEANCGACGRTCASGFTCRLGACEPNFRVASLTAANCHALDQMNIVGDDRGGIVANVSYTYYNGDLGTGRALSAGLTSLTLVTASGAPVDGLVTNIRSGSVYSLSTDGSTPFRYNGATAATFTHLLELNATTLAPTGTRITLTPGIPFDPTLAGRYGVFSGYDRVVIYNNTRALNISLPSGAVTDLGAVPLPSPQACESWAFWGFAEFFGDAVWLVYRQYVSGTVANIVRVRVSDGTVQTVGSFTNLSDMCSIAALPARNRWYWHHEGTSQFSAFASGEALGYCDATYAFTN